jgi:hypothetical protein
MRSNAGFVAESDFVKSATRSMTLSNWGITFSVKVLPNCDHAASSRFWFFTPKALWE